MKSAIWTYTIQVPPTEDVVSFTDLFNWMDIEGLEEMEDKIKVYVRAENTFEMEEHLENIVLMFDITFTKELLEEKNWNEDWERNFEPIKIGHLAVVRASFHTPVAGVLYDIIIDPKMSFGTGHHATTRQMMQMMGRLPLSGKKVLDVGSGTGILSILAAKMGAAEVISVDNDEWCYNNHRENNALNSVSSEVLLGGLKDVKDTDFDLILANIQRNYLLEHMEALASHLRKDGLLMISGLLIADEMDLLKKSLECHLIAHYLTESEGWACILLRKN
jgi:ribosomal protein L11 methyltransferase